MTKREQLAELLTNWESLGAPDPAQSVQAFVRWALDSGHIEGGIGHLRRLVGSIRNSSEASAQHAYNADTDAYTFSPRLSEQWTLQGETVRNMKRAYANPPYGLGWSINRMCREWQLSRAQFNFLRKTLAWTHDQDEFTREEHLARDTPELLDDREQRSRWQLAQAANEAERQELQRLARLGQDIEARNEALRLAIQAGGGVSQRTPPPRTGERVLIVPMSDLHIGGPDSRLVEAHVLRFVAGLPKDIPTIVVWNGDLFHVDTPRLTTTRGTHLDADTFSPYEILSATYGLGIAVQTELNPTQTVVVSGNHDEMASMHWLLALRALGYACDDQRDCPMKFIVWADELFLFEHGDGGRGKVENLLLAFTQSQRTIIGQTKRTWVWTGHLHHVKQVDVGGAIHHQLGSPARNGRWGRKNAYSSLPVLQAFEFEASRGLVCTHWSVGGL